MKLGKISESVLKRSVIKPLSQNKTSDSSIEKGIDVAVNGAIIKIPEGKELVATTDPVTTAYNNMPLLCVTTVINDLYTMKATPVAVLVTILLSPDKRESYLKRIMEELIQACNKYNVLVINGHTETTDAVNRPIISITGLGYKDTHIEEYRVKPGDSIIMTKGIGIEGTAVMAYDREKELKQKFSTAFVESCKDYIKYICVKDEAKIAFKYNTQLHDASEGGLFGALWEIGERNNLGIKVSTKDIFVKQEAIEVCELFSINPYTLISGGTLLVITDTPDEILEEYKEAGIDAKIIGVMIKDTQKIVEYKDEHGELVNKFLEPPKGEVSYSLHQ